MRAIPKASNRSSPPCPPTPAPSSASRPRRRSRPTPSGSTAPPPHRAAPNSDHQARPAVELDRALIGFIEVKAGRGRMSGGGRVLFRLFKKAWLPLLLIVLVLLGGY